MKAKAILNKTTTYRIYSFAIMVILAFVFVAGFSVLT